MFNYLIILLLFFSSMIAYSYEYVIQDYVNPVNHQTVYKFFNDNTGRLHLTVDINGIERIDDGEIWISLSRIKFGNGLSYIDSSVFDDYYKNDVNFLNDLFVYFPQRILNYFYTTYSFNSSYHIEYDYELLYNSDGLAVESVVNGVYAGLYDMASISTSGNLYNYNGDLVLVNGVEPSFFQKLYDKIVGNVHLKMLDAENLIDKNWIFAVFLTIAILYFIVRFLKKSLVSKNNKGLENES